jgi:NAD-dependent dihydropyrimidine dehydrogenase PreA subunit
MKTICSKDSCTGCGACRNACPRQCIHMQQDDEGFLFPEVYLHSCNSCGNCRRVCPALSARLPRHGDFPNVYACWNRDNTVRFQSASGGVFSAIAEEVIKRRGIVYGAAFDNKLHLKHLPIYNSNELWRLRSSKYIQSDTGTVYSEIDQFLNEKRPVLFSGTPCQVAALKAYVAHDNDLLTCDLLCHGVPSPGLFAKYVAYLEDVYGLSLSAINFRHKRAGWEMPSTVALFDNKHEKVLRRKEDSFKYGFSHSITLRRSCYRCPYAGVERHGDISLGDFTKIGEAEPFFHSVKQGVSLVLVNSPKGELMLESCSGTLFLERRTLAEAQRCQARLRVPARKPPSRQDFFIDYQRLEYGELAHKYLVEKGWKALLRPFVPQPWILYIKKRLNKISGLCKTSLQDRFSAKREKRPGRDLLPSPAMKRRGKES